MDQVNEIPQTSLTENSVICLGCYKKHLQMAMEDQSDLESLIAIWEWEGRSCDNLTKAVLKTVCYVLTEFFNNRDMLLLYVSQVLSTWAPSAVQR